MVTGTCFICSYDLGVIIIPIDSCLLRARAHQLVLQGVAVGRGTAILEGDALSRGEAGSAKLSEVSPMMRGSRYGSKLWSYGAGKSLQNWVIKTGWRDVRIHIPEPW